VPGYNCWAFLAHALIVEERTAEHFERITRVGDVGASPVTLLRLGDMEMMLSTFDIAVDLSWAFTSARRPA
jgi:hypothetical protein